MAMRYCGDARIRIRWIDAVGEYRYTVTIPDDRSYTQKRSGWIKPPPACKDAVDNPRSYDIVAHAVLSFALDEEDSERGFMSQSGLECEAGTSGTAHWHIRRKPLEPATGTREERKES